jgi:hypothetical protein
VDLESLLEQVQAEPDSPDKADALALLEEQLAAVRAAEEAEGPLDVEAANFEPEATGGPASGESGAKPDVGKRSAGGGPPKKAPPFGAKPDGEDVADGKGDEDKPVPPFRKKA